MRRWLRRIAVVIALLAGPLFFVLHHRPSVSAYESLAMDEAPAGPGLRVTFLGVSTLYIRDQSAAILIDGFFTRPGLLRTATAKIGPDQQRIASALDKAGITKLDAIITAHS